jgi:hypothetical protein
MILTLIQNDIKFLTTEGQESVLNLVFFSKIHYAVENIEQM